MPVITISRLHGARAGEVVKRLVRKIGINVASKKEVEGHLRGVVGGFLAEKYTSEREPTFFDTIIYNMELWRGLLHETVLKTALEGNVIIYGRGGSVILADVPGVVNILIVGNRKKRIEYIAGKQEVTQLEAEEIIRDTEKRREGFFSHHFGVSWPNPESFDLSLNPLKVGIDRSVDILQGLLEMESIESDYMKKGKKVMEQRYVVASSANRITLVTDLHKNFFDVTLNKGKVINIAFYDVPKLVREKAVSAVSDFHKGYKVLQKTSNKP